MEQTLNRFVIQNPGEAIRIWPGPLPATIQSEQYGQDESYTYELHRTHDVWARTPAAGQVPQFADAIALAPDSYKKWLRTVNQARTSRHLNPQVLKNLYDSTLRLTEIAQVAAGRVGCPKPVARLGPSLEAAVARRVHEWLAASPHPAVQTVWSNVVAARERTPHEAAVNFDVLLVLWNGVLLHLECKSAELDEERERDLDVRILRLQRASSNLARLAVVLPVFTRSAADPWFLRLAAQYSKLKEAGLPVLPFTSPGQPDTYVLPHGENTDPISVPTFEQALEELLSRYRHT